MSNQMITFEQPLNELIRICLRLEHLFEIITFHHKQHSTTNSRCALTAMLDVLNVIERPDLKTKLVKALTKHANRLSNLEKMHNVDQNKLAACLAELDTLIDVLHTQPGRIGQALKDNDFLATVRQRLSIPAGDCNFNLPCYQRWLAQNASERIANLHEWMQSYTHLKAATDLLLKLTRQSAPPVSLNIADGFHQQNLDPNNAWQLLRLSIVSLPNLNMYPEVSVGPHRLSIRIHEMNTNGRPSQSMHTLKCQLTLCANQK